MAMKDKDSNSVKKTRENNGTLESPIRGEGGKFLKGKPPGPGRKKGVPNKVTREIQELAQQYGPEAIEALQEMAFDPKRDDSVRLKAIGMLLDRGYGKPKEFKDLDVNVNRHESIIEEIYDEIEDAFTGGHSVPGSKVH